MSELITAKQQDESVRYLGVKISTTNDCMVKENIIAVVNYFEEKCRLWMVYKLSWLSRIAAV